MPVVTDPDQLIRLTDARYADGVNQLYEGADAVEIAQAVFDQDEDIPDPDGNSNLFVSWGQFLDHDLSLTPDASGELVHAGLVAPLVRSVFDPASDETGPREQLNEITPEIDASQVYGSTFDRTAALRSFEGGRLLVDDGDTFFSPYDLLPANVSGLPMAGDNDSENPLFLAGDLRANENTGLTILHTVFVREHNYWAGRLEELHPDWADEALFEVARSIVEFEIQLITYRDWLPHLLGDAVDAVELPEDVDGRIATEFSTAAFRFGHTMVSSGLDRLSREGQVEGSLSVQGQFFNVDVFREFGIDGLLRGQMAGTAQALDTKVIDDLNFFLQLPDGTVGFSLPALNILRSRDHGIDSYVNVRAALIGNIDPETLDPSDFSIISSDISVQQELAAAYGTVHEVDLWVGGLAEDSVAGSKLGVTFTTIISDQFARTRAADDTFGLLDLRIDDALLDEVQNSSLSDIINRTTEIGYLQEDVFVSALRLAGSTDDDTLIGGVQSELIIGFSGDDEIDGGSGSDSIYAGDGSDIVFGGDGDDSILGGDSEADSGDTIHAGSGNDTVDAGIGDDRLYGEAGHDQLHAGTGRDTIWAGAGNDTVYGDQPGFGYGDLIFAGGGNDEIHTSYGDDTVYGGWGNDLILTGEGRDRIYSGEGADTVICESTDPYSNDTVHSGSGDDLVETRGGNDFLCGRLGDDTLFGGAGIDTLYGDNGDDILSGGLGADDLFGGAGSDVADYTGASDAVRADLQAPGTNAGEAAGDTYTSIENLVGSDFSDFLGGNNGRNQLEGGAGNDELRGRKGDDTLLGGADDDMLWGDRGRDWLDGGAGDDTLRGGADADTFAFSAGFDHVFKYDSGDVINLAAALGIDDYIDLLENHLSENNGHAVITDDGGNEMTLIDVPIALLNESDFVF